MMKAMPTPPNSTAGNPTAAAHEGAYSEKKLRLADAIMRKPVSGVIQRLPYSGAMRRESSAMAMSVMAATMSNTV